MKYEIIILIATTLMCWHCFSFFYIVNFLRRSEETDLSFISTIVSALTGNIGTFYKVFISSHSRKHNPTVSKLIAYSSILSFVGLLLFLFIFAIVDNVLAWGDLHLTNRCTQHERSAAFFHNKFWVELIFAKAFFPSCWVTFTLCSSEDKTQKWLLLWHECR